MVNGRSSFEPRFFAEAIARTRCFPDPASLAYLRGAGVGSVVIHTELELAPRPASCGPRSDVREVRRGPLLIVRIRR